MIDEYSGMVLEIWHCVQCDFLSILPSCFSADRWCKLIRQVRLSGVVVIIIDSVSSDDVIQHQNAFRFLTDNFPLVSFHNLLLIISLLSVNNAEA